MNGNAHSRWDRLDDLEPLAVEVGYCIGALAARLGVSRRQLSRLFREKSQTCPREWLAQVRLRYALAKTRENVAVKVIALDLGYHHCSDFIRAFRHLTGNTPGKVGRGSPDNHLLGEEVFGMAQNAYRNELPDRAP
jgi:AraC-like DNA-binding protein